jgi:hypothetical protein
LYFEFAQKNSGVHCQTQKDSYAILKVFNIHKKEAKALVAVSQELRVYVVIWDGVHGAG